MYPSVPTGSISAKPSFSGPFSSGLRQASVATGGYPQFGNAGAAAAKEAGQLGKLAALKAFGRYYISGENKDAVKALFWQFGVPTGLGLCFLIPVAGWAVGLAGIPFGIWAAKKGSKMRKQLALEGKGPFVRLAEISGLYNDATHYGKGGIESVEHARSFSGKIIGCWNKFCEELFPDHEHKVKNLQQLVNKLQLKEEGLVHRLLGHSLEVQYLYRNKMAGRALRLINSTIGKVKIEPLRLPLMGVKALLVGGLMLANRASFAKTIKASVSKLA